jgi:hypothetical protein
VLIGGLIGLALGSEEVERRWRVRLEELGVDDVGVGEILIGFLGKKQRLESVESNYLVGEFCWITRFIYQE